MSNNLLKTRISNILTDINEVDMDEKDILELKNKMKEIEKKIKEKNKPKTITISGKDHSIIKEYCTTLNLNIGDWTAKVLLDKIEADKCYISLEDDEYDEIEKEEITKRYIDNQKHQTLYKFDKLIINKDFHFKGYSIIDSNPLYKCDNFNNNTKTLLDSNGITCKLTSERELGKRILENMELEIEII